MPALLVLLLALASPDATAPPAPAAAPALESNDDKLLYAIGIALSRQLTAMRLTDAELELVKAGLVDGALGRPPQVEMETYGPRLSEFALARVRGATEETMRVGKEFLAKVGAEEGIEPFESGLLVRTLQEGAGANPSRTDTVKVRYTGTLIDGTVFDTSENQGGTVEFALNRVIACWTEGIPKIKVGGRAMLYCPAELAYGERPNGIIPGGSTLIFEVELLEIIPEKSEAPAP